MLVLFCVLLGLMEVVFCDDGSSDGSVSEIQRCCELHLKDKDRFVVSVLRSERNMGAGFARNRCVEAALGEYFCFVDSDDLMIGRTVCLFVFCFFFSSLFQRIASLCKCSIATLIMCWLAGNCSVFRKNRRFTIL